MLNNCSKVIFSALVLSPGVDAFNIGAIFSICKGMGKCCDMVATCCESKRVKICCSKVEKRLENQFNRRIEKKEKLRKVKELMDKWEKSEFNAWGSSDIDIPATETEIGKLVEELNNKALVASWKLLKKLGKEHKEIQEYYNDKVKKDNFDPSVYPDYWVQRLIVRPVNRDRYSGKKFLTKTRSCCSVIVLAIGCLACWILLEKYSTESWTGGAQCLFGSVGWLAFCIWGYSLCLPWCTMCEFHSHDNENIEKKPEVLDKIRKLNASTKAAV